jgi:hypothetical protein
MLGLHEVFRKFDPGMTHRFDLQQTNAVLKVSPHLDMNTPAGGGLERQCLIVNLLRASASWHMCVYCRHCAGRSAVDCAYIRSPVPIFVCQYMRDMLIPGYLQKWGNPCPRPPTVGVAQVHEFVGGEGRSVHTRTICC